MLSLKNRKSSDDSLKEEIEKMDKKLKLKKLESIHPVLPKADEKCIIHYKDNKIELPILQGTDGSKLIDIQTLYGKGGLFCYDPGYTYTGSCMSAITLSREDGQVFYRGYPVQELVEQCSFIEVAYIILYGDRPSPDELLLFENRIKNEMLVHQKIHDLYKGFHHDANPMAKLGSVVAGLSSFMGEEKLSDSKYREATAIKLIAKMPVLAAIAFRTSVGLPVVCPNKNLEFVENFLHMMF